MDAPPGAVRGSWSERAGRRSGDTPIGGARRDAEGRAARSQRRPAAVRISCVVLPGWEIITTCEAPLTSTVAAWMRSAMNRRLAVPIVLSAPATRYHDGIVAHAG